MKEHSTSAVYPATYQLIVAGYLDHGWASWFDDMIVCHLPNGTTSLTGAVIDQVALYSLLARARDLGLTLLLLQRWEPREKPL